MKILYPNLFPDDPALKLNFEVLETSDTPNIEFHIDPRNFTREPNIKYYCLDFELPNGFIGDPGRNDAINLHEKSYDKIFTICPYTVKIRNKFLQKELYHYVFFPSPFEWNKSNEKIYDVFYAGSGSDYILNDEILKFKYKAINQIKNKYITDTNVSFDEKLNLISKSKITIVHNIINIEKFSLNFDTSQYFNIGQTKLPFKHLTQHKSRVIEASRCKSLILCKEDDFNIIEDFFTPNVHFIYFNNENLGEKLTEILNNYSNYTHIIENAFKKVNECYGINNFYKKYIL